MSDDAVVVELDPYPPEPRAWLARRCRLVGHADSLAALSEARAILVRTRTRVDEALLDTAPRLRVVARAGAGLDNVDVVACRARGVDVVYRPDANTQAVVEYVVTLICDALRPRRPLTSAIDEATWERLRREATAPRQMSERTLGILGLGRIGRRVAAVTRILGFDVIYNDLLVIPESEAMGARAVPLETLFDHSDVISIHVDGRRSNRGLVGDALLARLPEDALILNTSRGFVVDRADLARHLRKRPGMCALLDVHEPEPVPNEDPLIGIPNAVLLPHLASRTERAVREMGWVVRDVVEVLEGRPPSFPAPD